MLVENQSSHTIIRHTNNLFLKTYKKGIEAALNTFFCIFDDRNEFSDEFYIK